MSETSAPATVRRKRFSAWAIAVVMLTCLAFGLVATNLLYAEFAKQDVVLDGDSGELLYVAAFSGFADEWELYEGQQRAQIVDEQLELAVRVPQTATWSTARHRLGDFDARVTAHAREGPIDNAFGVVFSGFKTRLRASAICPPSFCAGSSKCFHSPAQPFGKR